MAAPLFLLMFVGYGIHDWMDSPRSAAIPVLIGAIGFWVLVFRLRLRVRDQFIEARNVFSTKTMRTDLIDTIECGYWGLEVAAYDGTSITVTAIQQPNFITWFHWESRSDRIRAEILARRDQVVARQAT